MTTDTVPKACSRRVSIGGKPVTVTGIAKGAGMIHPDMATLLGFVATDAAVSQAALQKMLAQAAARSFNRITVDGDTSTNDSFMLMASGAAGNQTDRRRASRGLQRTRRSGHRGRGLAGPGDYPRRRRRDQVH